MRNLIFILLFIPGVLVAQDGPQIFYGPRGSGTGFDSTFMDYRLLALEAKQSWLANGTTIYPQGADTTKFKIANLFVSPAMQIAGANYTTTIGGNTSTFSSYVTVAASGSQGTIAVSGLSNPSAIYMIGSATPYITLRTTTTTSIAHISTYGSWFGLNTAFPSGKIGMSALNTQGLRADTVIAPIFVSVADSIRWTIGADSIDCAAASTYYGTVTASDTLYIKGMTGTATQSQTVNIILTNTGAYTLTWDPAILWPNNTPPTLTTTANKIDVFTLVKVNGRIYGNKAQNYGG